MQTDDDPSVLKVWDATTGQEILDPRGISREALSLAFSPDGRWIATGDNKGDVTVWDATIGQVVTTLGTHSLRVCGLAFSSDGQRLASLSSEGMVIVYDAMTRPGRKHNFVSLLSSLNIMLESREGYESSTAECADILQTSGFVRIKVRHLIGPTSAVFGYKPGRLPRRGERW